jgi:hypothetical protein
MSLKNTCRFHNELESVTIPVTSAIGLNLDGKRNSPAITTGRFGNALDTSVSAGSSLYTTTDQSGIGTSEGVIGFWINSLQNIIGGVPSSNNSDVLYFYDFSGRVDVITFILNVSAGLRFQFNVNGSASGWDSKPAGFNMTAGTWYHVLLVWKLSHLTKKRRIYFEGVEVASDNTLWVDDGSFAVPVVVGARMSGAVVASQKIDNIKIYDDASDENIIKILANRNNEGFGGLRLLDGGMDSPLLSGVLM